jgi:hypothetical protein
VCRYVSCNLGYRLNSRREFLEEFLQLVVNQVFIAGVRCFGNAADWWSDDEDREL